MSAQPNVIFIITDDQGYGDLGCTGNPWMRTPNLDGFYGESVRLTDFHVAPLCAPTRGALMTGRRPTRNGVWATAWGRSILRRSEMTMADAFAASGYRTGMFGKWHLGDNYPYRPQDRGFHHVVAHKGGGVGQVPDFWGNNYFDDIYLHNGAPVEHSGYCTDVWFEEAMKFIEECGDAPFFAYIATNAPHHPYLVAERYRAMYADNPEIPEPAFCGMITNIDENFGQLRAWLAARGLEENTLLVFMTDNGSSAGVTLDARGFATAGYNAGMRGMKGSYYDGGHRVPFFLRWPGGGMTGGRDIDDMALHVDVLPTFIDLCGLTPPREVAFDGASLAPLLCGEASRMPGDRLDFVQFRQHTEPPEQWTSAVISRRWRLVYGRELYDIAADPGQRHDVAAAHPDVVARLRAAHEAWWAEVAPELDIYSPIVLGNDAENPTRLDAMDVMGDIVYQQSDIARAMRATGRWTVEVETPGDYTFALRRWPEEVKLPIEAAIDTEDAQHLVYSSVPVTPRSLHPVRAMIKLFGEEWTLPVDASAEEVTFRIPVTRTGVTELEAWFIDAEGEPCGAYYVYVTRLP